MKNTMGRTKTLKAYALTTDAMFAMLILFTVVLLIANMTFQAPTQKSTYMKLVSLDTLKVLENQGRVSYAIEGNTTSVREVFNMLQGNMCMQLSIINDLGQQNATIEKQNCAGYKSEIQIVNRGYVHDNRIYTLQLTTWLKS